MISVTWLAMWIKWGPAEHRTISQGKPMNELLGSTRRAQASVQSGQELGTENSQSNEFMTVFSHELGNSLGAIRMAAQILRMETSAGPATVKARVLIERQVGQMTRLVEDLLDVSRIRGGQLRLQCERIDLRAVTAHDAQTVELTMQQRNHWMTTSFPDAPVWLQADPSVIAPRGRGPRYRTRLGAQSGRAPWRPRHRGKRWSRARKRVHCSPTNACGVVLGVYVFLVADHSTESLHGLCAWQHRSGQ